MLAERIGEFLLMEKAITVQQLAAALDAQRHTDPRRFLGDILVENGTLARAEFQTYLKRYLLQLGHNAPDGDLFIGKILVQAGRIPAHVLENALLAQRESRPTRFLGEILVASGALTLEELEVFLSNQNMLRQGAARRN